MVFKMKRITKIKKIKTRIYLFDFKNQKFSHQFGVIDCPSQVNQFITGYFTNFLSFPHKCESFFRLIDEPCFREDAFSRNLCLDDIKKDNSSDEIHVYLKRHYTGAYEHTAYRLPLKTATCF